VIPSDRKALLDKFTTSALAAVDDVVMDELEGDSVD